MKFFTNNALYKFLCNRFVLFSSNSQSDRLFSRLLSHTYLSISLIPILKTKVSKISYSVVSKGMFELG